MTDRSDPLTIPIEADFTSFQREILAADRMAQGFGRSLNGAFSSAILRGRDLGDVFRSLALNISAMALKSALTPLTSGLGDMLGGLFSQVMPFAKGGVVGPTITPFASGGVVRAPTYFPMANNNLGLMGESGSEAILPLARGSDGRLGVRASSGAGSASIHVSINARDAESFRRSESEITASIARAVARGQRSL